MNKIVQTGIAIICIILFSGLSRAGEAPATDDQWEAKTVVESFLDAQSQGDTQALKQHLGGDLLKKRSRLLDNPEYSGLLRETYEDVIWTITNYETLSDGSIQIDVQMDTADQDTRQIRYVLIKKISASDSPSRFLIYSQTEISA